MTKFKEYNLEPYCNCDILLTKNVIKDLECLAIDLYKTEWHNKLVSNAYAKLRTYKLFKTEFKVENYICKTIAGKYRSAFAKFRCGVAPLKIETGRYQNLPINERICFSCNDTIEDEKHVILKCPLYADFRAVLFSHADSFCHNFNSMSDDDEFVFLFSDENVYFNTAKICYDILLKRKCLLYS